MTTTPGQDRQPRCPGQTCLTGLADRLFRPGRDHHGVGYLEVAATGDRLPARPGTRRDVDAIRNRIALAHRPMESEHLPPSDAALKRAAGEAIATTADAAIDAQPLAEALSGEVIERSTTASWREGLDDLPPEWRVPTGYEVTRTGVFRRPTSRTDSDAEPEPQRIAYGPVLPVRVLTDPDGRQVLDIGWLGSEHRGWVVRSVPRAIARAGRRLVAALGDEGLPVIESDGKHIERWLAEAESVNRDVIPNEPLALWLGWQPDGTFLSRAGQERRLQWRWLEQAQAAEWIRPAGTLAGWQDAIRQLSGDPVVLVVLATAFAAPLLAPLGLPTAILDIFGPSTRGKTTAARIAYSVWGAPSADDGVLGSWADTLVGLEKRASLAQGLLCVLDDSQKSPRPDDIRQFVYMIAQGRGRGRSHPDHPNAVPIRTWIISTGERAIHSFGNAQGLAPRRIPLVRTPFPRTADPAAEAARIGGILAALGEHHGTAGPAFVERLMAGLAGDGRQKLLDRHSSLIDAAAGESPLSARRAPAVAALRLGALLAHEWGIVPVEPPPWSLWSELFLTDEATDGEDIGQAALNVVASELAARPDRFYDPHRSATWTGDGRTPNGGWFARHVAVGGVQHIAASKEQVAALLDARGYTYGAVIELWKEAKVIVRIESGVKPRWSKRTTLGPGRTSTDLLVFSSGSLDGDPDDTADG